MRDNVGVECCGRIELDEMCQSGWEERWKGEKVLSYEGLWECECNMFVHIVF